MLYNFKISFIVLLDITFVLKSDNFSLNIHLKSHRQYCDIHKA